MSGSFLILVSVRSHVAFSQDKPLPSSKTGESWVHNAVHEAFLKGNADGTWAIFFTLFESHHSPHYTENTALIRPCIAFHHYRKQRRHRIDDFKMMFLVWWGHRYGKTHRNTHYFIYRHSYWEGTTASSRKWCVGDMHLTNPSAIEKMQPNINFSKWWTEALNFELYFFFISCITKTKDNSLHFWLPIILVMRQHKYKVKCQFPLPGFEIKSLSLFPATITVRVKIFACLW